MEKFLFLFFLLKKNHTHIFNFKIAYKLYNTKFLFIDIIYNIDNIDSV